LNAAHHDPSFSGTVYAPGDGIMQKNRGAKQKGTEEILLFGPFSEIGFCGAQSLGLDFSSL
jgi:hypothetical protein